jgi:hypothetical protein
VWDTEITHVTVKGVSVQKAEWEPGDNFIEKDIRWNEWMGRLVEFVDDLPVAQASSKAEPKLSVSPKKAAAKKEAPAPPLPAAQPAAAPPPAPPLPAPPAQPAPLASPASPVSIAPFSYDGECAGCMYSFEHKRTANIARIRNIGGVEASHSCSRALCKKEGCNHSRGGPALEMMEGFGYCAAHKKEREIVSAVLPVAPAPQASLSSQKKKAVTAALSSLATRNIDAVIDTASDDDSEAAASLTWEEYLCGPGGTPTTPSRWEEIGDEWDVVLGGEGGGDVADERRDDQPEVPDLDSDAGRDRAWSHDSVLSLLHRE